MLLETRPRPAVVTLAAVHAAVLLAAGGLVGMVALLPIAVAADSCTASSAALLCTGLPQLVALVVIALGVLGSVVVAALGARRGGWGALAHALGGWLTLATSLVLAGLVLWASS
ncbi:hypothetical protein GCM10023201_04250 [Actinomycetospora corticicola]|uniref:Uncharacterized protein n=1 Tax=Actinomycetospora corticicola TaxID=663602 RepID=A0A7Y9J4C5_9PSEU|nr:hypothetical protein [Actinomycetospora corticicola]NYD34927.1 hypothetical protein [Actinomycetospora corticicola]